MFGGDFLHTEATGYVVRNRSDRDKWSHWKIVVTRARYSDQASVSVEITFFFARKAKKCWVSARKPQFQHYVPLGNMNYPGEKERLRTIDDEHGKPTRNNPDVLRELETIITDFSEYATGIAEDGRPIDSHELTLIVQRACLKQKNEQAL